MLDMVGSKKVNLVWVCDELYTKYPLVHSRLYLCLLRSHQRHYSIQ